MAMQETYSIGADNLFAGTQVQPVVADEIIVRAGSGVLKRGTVLGQVTVSNSATATADGGNTGNGAMGTVTLLPDAITGTYNVEITKEADGGDPAEFEVQSPTGAKATGTVGSDFEGLGIKFKITAGATPFAEGDKWTIAVVEGKGEYVICDSNSAAGATAPVCVLAETVDASERDVRTVGYFTGEFNSRALIFGGTDTAATHIDAARARGLFFKDAVPA